MPSTRDARRRRDRANLRLAAATLDEMKLSAGCVDCGYKAHPSALHFDHVDPSTKRSQPGWRDDRSRLTTRARLLAFVEHVQTNCVIRCANCHAVRSVREQHWNAQHTAETFGVAQTLF